jgi:hypothetical protein
MYDVVSVEEVPEIDTLPAQTRSERILAVLAGTDTHVKDCHGASLKLVQSGIFGVKARVARGWCDGVAGQHSWVAVSGDCYDVKGEIVDPTLHQYRPDVDAVDWRGTISMPGWHRPHGFGSLFDVARPYNHGGEVIELDPSTLSRSARTFLEVLGPLDAQGWIQRAFIPIDIVGMLTDINPGGFYR